MLEFRQLDNKARQKEVNLIFSGCPEVFVEYSECVVEKVLTENLKLQFPERIKIVRAYRMGQIKKPKTGERQPVKSKPRTIFVTFSDVSQVHCILSQAKELKETSISTLRDYPDEIAAARKSLSDECKALRSEHGVENVKTCVSCCDNSEEKSV